jgi:kynurenine formamidase
MPLPDDFHEIAERVNNWGRWGADDERGTVNLIDEAAVQRGAASVLSGERVNLSLPLSSDGPQAGLVKGRDNPTHRMIRVNSAPTGDATVFATSDDAIDLALQAATHWDALAHVAYRGVLYNGHPADSVTESGARRCGIDKVGAVVSRGVLLDVAGALGHDILPPAYAITPDDLDAAAALGEVMVEPGDVALIRTGQIRHFHAGDRMAYAFPSPGLTMETAVWLHDRDVAAVATDSITFEVFPRRDIGANGEHMTLDDLIMPVHLLHLVEMGLLQGQNFDLEELAEACASDGRYTFLLSATPEPVVGGVGGPVAAVAIR